MCERNSANRREVGRQSFGVVEEVVEREQRVRLAAAVGQSELADRSIRLRGRADGRRRLGRVPGG